MFVFHRIFRRRRTRPRVVVRCHTTPHRSSALEPLESRALFSATTAVGSVQNVYPAPDGSPITTPLADWTVFDDANRNGSLDPGERAATTALDGSYSLPLDPGSHTLRLALKSGWSTPAGYASADTLTIAPGTASVQAPTLSAAMTSPNVVDVVAFTADSSLNWSSLIPGYFRTANEVFANSDTNVRLNLVAIRPASYTPAGNLNTDLSRLALRGDGYMDSLPSTRDALGADLAILFDPTYPPTAAGLAYIPSVAHPDPTYGFGVVCYTGDPTFDGFTTAHEIGHLFGADHDASAHPSSASPAYARGYAFTGNDGVLYHDVMAYPPGTTLPFFSDPDLSYAGHPLGDPATADNVRVIRQTAAAVANFRTPPAAAAAASAPTTPAAKPTPNPLVATAVNTTKFLAIAGTQVTATATVRNTGKSPFAGQITVTFYLSKDKTLDPSDAVLARNTVTRNKLKRNGTLRTSTDLPLAPSATAGAYYVLAAATTPANAQPARASASPLKVAAAPAPAKKKKKPAPKHKSKSHKSLVLAAAPTPSPFQSTLPISVPPPATDDATIPLLA